MTNWMGNIIYGERLIAVKKKPKHSRNQDVLFLVRLFSDHTHVLVGAFLTGLDTHNDSLIHV